LKKETEKFKEGDIVRCVRQTIGHKTFKLIINSIHVIQEVWSSTSIVLVSNIFSPNNDESLKYSSNRFIKVKACNLTKEEKFTYIKYKLGVKKAKNINFGILVAITIHLSK